MTKVITLTQEQADQVRGTSAAGTALNPIPYHLGGFILPLAVLDDPTHADQHDFLAALPQVDYVSPPVEDL